MCRRAFNNKWRVVYCKYRVYRPHTFQLLRDIHVYFRQLSARRIFAFKVQYPSRVSSNESHTRHRWCYDKSQGAACTALMAVAIHMSILDAPLHIRQGILPTWIHRTPVHLYTCWWRQIRSPFRTVDLCDTYLPDLCDAGWPSAVCCWYISTLLYKEGHPWNE